MYKRQIKYYIDEAFDFFYPNKRLETYYKKYLPEIIWEILQQMCVAVSYTNKMCIRDRGYTAWM